MAQSRKRVRRAALLVGWLALGLAAPAEWAAAQQRATGALPRGVIPSPVRGQVLSGRVVEVRRLSRELTVRTTDGAVHHVTVGPGAKISAPGLDSFDAVRSGVTVKVTAEADRRGQLHATAVAVRPEAKAQ